MAKRKRGAVINTMEICGRVAPCFLIKLIDLPESSVKKVYVSDKDIWSLFVTHNSSDILVASFPNKLSLNEWWDQVLQLRAKIDRLTIPVEGVAQKKTPKKGPNPRRPKNNKGNHCPSPLKFTDPNKPQSEKYGMPEWDYE